MLKIKHFLDPALPDDGQRLWVEPIGLTLDLQAWCAIDHVLSDVGPPPELWQLFHQHPDGFEHFRNAYHDYLDGRRALRAQLMEFAHAATCSDFTLVHQGDDVAENTATALYEYLTELTGYLKTDG